LGPSVSSTTRCHLSINFETPWYGRSGEGERTPGDVGGSSGVVALRSPNGDGKRALVCTVRSSADDLAIGEGDRRAGKPFAPVVPPDSLVATGTRVATCSLAESLSRAQPAFLGLSGTSKEALDETGDELGDSLGKREAADEGEANDASALPLACFSFNATGFEATGGAVAGGPGPWPFAPIAS